MYVISHASKDDEHLDWQFLDEINENRPSLIFPVRNKTLSGGKLSPGVRVDHDIS